MNRYNAFINQSSLIISDCFSFLLASLIVNCIAYIRGTTVFPVAGNISSPEGISRGLFLIVLAGIGVFWFWVKLRHYSYRKPFWSELKEILQAIGIFALLDAAFLAFSKHDFSRLEWSLFWILVFIFLLSFRVFTKKYLTFRGYWQRPCVIIGCGDNALEAYQAISSERLLGMDVKAFIISDLGRERSAADLTSIPIISIDEFWHQCAFYTKVYIALEHNDGGLTQSWLRTLSSHDVRDVSVIPSLRGIPLYGMEVSHFFSHEVMILRLRNNLATLPSRVVKRTFDIAVSSLLLISLSPLFVLIALKIKQDGGSITYGHERVGFQGKSFSCLKFRSMVSNSQEVLADLLATDAAAKKEWEKDFKLKSDPRITPIGKFLRKTSLDELPQLWNVLKGDMSLVGPRPVVADELKRYREDIEYYLMVKPGMTGLWQVSGRSDTDYATRVYFDTWYVKNWSIWYDVAILFKTIKVVLARDGAY